MAKKKGVAGNAPVKKEKSEIAVADFLQTDNTGFEHYDQSELTSRIQLKLCQKGTEISNPDIQVGDFFSTGTEKTFGNAVNVVVLGGFNSYVEWDESDSSAPVGTYTEAQFNSFKNELTEVEGKWDVYVNEKGNTISKSHNLILFLPDYPEEGILMFIPPGASVSPSKHLVRKIHKVKYNGNKIPIYGTAWELTSGPDKDKANRTFMKLGGSTGKEFHLKGFVHEVYPQHTKTILEAFKEVQDMIKDFFKQGVDQNAVSDNDDIDF